MSEVKLGDIGKISMCKRILKSQTNEVSGIPFYKISTFGGIADVFIDEAIFHEYKEKYSYPKKGDILISAAGTVGKTVIYTGEDAYFQDSN
ncbi:TPA: restriction endonuclease subunit S, partial [Streptococcus suis]